MYLCVDTNTQQKYALKEFERVKMRNFNEHMRNKKIPTSEMDVLKQLNHINIVKLYEIIDDPSSENVYLVMDYLSGGTLQDKLAASQNGLEEEEVRVYFQQLIAAIHYCHEVMNFSHRDVKPENMMLDETGKLYLCDFGLSQFF